MLVFELLFDKTEKVLTESILAKKQHMHSKRVSFNMIYSFFTKGCAYLQDSTVFLSTYEPKFRYSSLL